MEHQQSKNEVFIEETFNASVERVFDAWTYPEKLMKWFAPNGCTVSFKKLEAKPGGVFHLCISNSDYGDCWCIGEYKEVIPNKKLVFSMNNADENGNLIDPVSIGMDKEWPGITLVTVTFEAMNGKTKLTLHQTVDMDLAKKTGAYPSWLQMLENMQTFLDQD